MTDSRDKTVIIWDLWTGSIITKLKSHSDYVLSVNFSSDSKYIATGS